MTTEEVLQTLESLGTEQNRKIYRRHEGGDNLFGVSFANLNALKKKLKNRQDLVAPLWESGYMEARTLAMMIAIPKALAADTIEKWAREVSCYGVADYFAGVAIQTSEGEAQMRTWMALPDEYLRRIGYVMLAHIANNDPTRGDDYFYPFIETIEAELQSSRNRAKQGMLNCLIAIGGRNQYLRERVEEAAQKIGLIEIDHGETACETPDIKAYLSKIYAHKAKKAAKK